MHLFQRLQHRAKDSKGFFLGELPTLLFQIRFQADSFYIFHHNIGSVVFIKEILYRNDTGYVRELRNVAGFIHIFFQTLLVSFTFLPA